LEFVSVTSKYDWPGIQTPKTLLNQFLLWHELFEITVLHEFSYFAKIIQQIICKNYLLAKLL